MSHFIEKCSICGTITAQCRCIDLNKTVRYVACKDCEAKRSKAHGVLVDRSEYEAKLESMK